VCINTAPALLETIQNDCRDPERPPRKEEPGQADGLRSTRTLSACRSPCGQSKTSTFVAQRIVAFARALTDADEREGSATPGRWYIDPVAERVGEAVDAPEDRRAEVGEGKEMAPLVRHVRLRVQESASSV
jgi:hypothetical protein